MAGLLGIAALVAATGLVAVEKTTFDEALAKPGVLASARAVVLDPPTVAYAKNPSPIGPVYREEDWKLTDADLERLRKIFREVYRDELAEAGVTLVDAAGPGVLRITPEIVDLRLTAPLHEDPSIRKTFVRSIGDLGLAAIVRDSVSGDVVATIRDVRRNIQVSADPNRGVRFTSTLYWWEAKRVLRGWAEATAALFPAKKGRS